MRKVIAYISISLILFSCGTPEKKIAFINNQKVYADFLLTKELNTKYNTIVEEKKKAIDSTALKVNIMAQRLEGRAMPSEAEVKIFELLREEYQEKQKQFEAESMSLQQQYNAEILTRMNEYLNTFGKQHGFDVLFGANGEGNIMYADSALDYTNEAIQFINKQYKGK